MGKQGRQAQLLGVAVAARRITLLDGFFPGCKQDAVLFAGEIFAGRKMKLFAVDVADVSICLPVGLRYIAGGYIHGSGRLCGSVGVRIRIVRRILRRSRERRLLFRGAGRRGLRAGS